MGALTIAIAAFVILLAVAVALRAKTGNRFEIRNSDIVLALVPIALWLFLTGQIKEFALGDFKIVAAITEASKSPVAPQVTAVATLPVEAVPVGAKEGLAAIPDLLRKRSQALSFRLGHGGYAGFAISEYLKVLTQYPFLRYVVISNPDGSFFGMLDARQLWAMMSGVDRQASPQAFADWLNAADRKQLEGLPGIILAEKALTKTSDKRKALQLMDALDVQTLPVIDDARRFAGVVDRSKLTASVLIDIAGRLEPGS